MVEATEALGGLTVGDKECLCVSITGNNIEKNGTSYFDEIVDARAFLQKTIEIFNDADKKEDYRNQEVILTISRVKMNNDMYIQKYNDTTMINVLMCNNQDGHWIPQEEEINREILYSKSLEVGKPSLEEFLKANDEGHFNVSHFLNYYNFPNMEDKDAMEIRRNQLSIQLRSVYKEDTIDVNDLKHLNYVVKRFSAMPIDPSWWTSMKYNNTMAIDFQEKMKPWVMVEKTSNQEGQEKGARVTVYGYFTEQEKEALVDSKYSEIDMTDKNNHVYFGLDNWSLVRNDNVTGYKPEVYQKVINEPNKFNEIVKKEFDCFVKAGIFKENSENSINIRPAINSVTNDKNEFVSKTGRIAKAELFQMTPSEQLANEADIEIKKDKKIFSAENFLKDHPVQKDDEEQSKSKGRRL